MQFKKWHNYKQGNEMYDKELLLEECVHSIIKQSLIEKLANRLYKRALPWQHANNHKIGGDQTSTLFC